jgi:hypothetical protein
MSLRLTDLVKRLLSRPTHRRPTPKLGCELLEGRVVPYAAVSVSTPVADVPEGGSAAFVFMRSETAGPLTVHFTVGGTASLAHDYTPFGTTVTFADGANTATATVAAVVDVIEEPTESVTVTLNPYYGYTVGTPNPATVLILNVQVPPATFDLDVDANGALGGPADGVANYLPGYEGTTAKVSTGTNLNAPAYQGQHLKLVLDGIGRDTPNLVQVEFELIQAKTTSYPGYASNRTHETIQGMGKEFDYSFHPYRDYFKQPAAPGPDDPITTITRDTQAGQVGGVLGNRPVGGEMEDTRTWISLYCKDYGGATEAKVTAHYNIGGMQQTREFILKIPLDVDNGGLGDGLADKWELEMGARWNAQYGVQLTPAEMLAGFAPGMDAEPADPDNAGPLVPQKDVGDAHTILEEYRGYILDGGGYNGAGANGHTGGHIRLDPARKEILVEVDRAATLNNIPNNDLPAILNGASKVFSNAARGAGIYMYWLFDQTLNMPLGDVNTLTKLRDKMSATRNATLKSDFLHLLLIDQGVLAATTNVPGILPVPALTIQGAAPVQERGSILATTDVDQEMPAARFPKRVEVFATTVAHELTHLLLKPVGVAGFDAEEHTKNANGNGTDGDADDRACLMYFDLAIESLELDTVKFFPLVQRELRISTSEGIDP